jgi:hypothetical protein
VSETREGKEKPSRTRIWGESEVWATRVGETVSVVRFPLRLVLGAREGAGYEKECQKKKRGPSRSHLGRG